ncbi:MAG: AraC family transcriptional regulator [Clostridium sp.]|uniref:AraC family transcriptional regulator n=1 Tax=Clostridium sp. TaxID=1506 RepID=UPI0025BD49E2|nr:AraC family transcriptional regulator [Clostridium sp.]MCH3964806.1 AraC family transcriptional regulator [Clostridium sp.]MCI1715277.1 AraC family transcriptional regulator [Clostridium sp.]MCI1799539.1 AraC family transcriptional regulator [Clostridium sp.]MCI1813460.1 AraC family transcriptional regulator [Clostridium sp.]MCI1870351.1 AraC family transcriptional regulator [Clostridium sp.]
MDEYFMKNDYCSFLSCKRKPYLSAVYLTDEFHSGNYPRMVHNHPNHLELLYAYKGEGEYIIGDERYVIKQGDLVIFNAGVLHGEDPFRYRTLCSYCCALTSVYLRGFKPNHLIESDIWPIVHCGKFGDDIKCIMKIIYYLFTNSKSERDICSSFASSLLMLVYFIVQKNTNDKEVLKEKQCNTLVNRIKKYLDVNYNEEINLNNISKSMNINRYYLAHLFKKFTGYSPIQYVRYRRIGEAQSLLMNTKFSVTRIASHFSYYNPSHFDVIFKKYVGMTPSHYRDFFAYFAYSENKTV